MSFDAVDFEFLKRAAERRGLYANVHKDANVMEENCIYIQPRRDWTQKGAPMPTLAKRLTLQEAWDFVKDYE
jgi:hypothetical protein